MDNTREQVFKSIINRKKKKLKKKNQFLCWKIQRITKFEKNLK